LQQHGITVSVDEMDKTGGEKTLFCLVHNIKKTYTRIMAKGGKPGDLAGELQ